MHFRSKQLGPGDHTLKQHTSHTPHIHAQALEVALRQAAATAAERARTLLQAQESISELQVSSHMHR